MRESCLYSMRRVKFRYQRKEFFSFISSSFITIIYQFKLTIILPVFPIRSYYRELTVHIHSLYPLHIARAGQFQLILLPKQNWSLNIKLN